MTRPIITVTSGSCPLGHDHRYTGKWAHVSPGSHSQTRIASDTSSMFGNDWKQNNICHQDEHVCVRLLRRGFQQIGGEENPFCGWKGRKPLLDSAIGTSTHPGWFGCNPAEHPTCQQQRLTLSLQFSTTFQGDQPHPLMAHSWCRMPPQRVYFIETHKPTAKFEWKMTAPWKCKLFFKIKRGRGGFVLLAIKIELR